MAHGLGNGETLHRHLAGAQPERDSRRMVAGGGIMMRQQFRLAVTDLRIVRLQHLSDAGVQRLALALQQRVIGGFLDQRMLEGVAGASRSFAIAGSKARGCQLGQPLAERHLIHLVERGDELIAEAATDHRADLRHSPRLGQAVETRRQGIAEGFGDRDAQGCAGINIAVSGLDQLARFENGSRQLLDEERHAVGLGDDLSDEFRRQRFAIGKPCDHLTALGDIQLGEIDDRDIVVMGPARLEFRPVRGHDQQGDPGKLAYQPLERLERGRIGPVHVLEQQERPAQARRRFHHVFHDTDGLQLGETRRNVERAVTLLERDRHHRGDEADILSRQAIAAGDHPLQPIELHVRRDIVADLQNGVEMGPDRIEGAVEMERRALEAQDLDILALEPRAQGIGDAALADSRLTAQVDGRTLMSVLDMAPLPEQAVHFVDTADQRRTLPLGRYRRSLRRRAEAADPIDMNRLRDALQGLRALILIVEGCACQLADLGTHHHAARLRHRLQAGGQIHRLADRGLAVGRNHDNTGGDADADTECRAIGSLEPCHGIEDIEPRANGALSLALVGARESEEGDDAIAETLEQIAVIAR